MSSPPARTDVVIAGAGILGCATAAYLAVAGLSVAIADAVGVAGGASGRNAGAIEHPYDAVQRDVYERSLRLMREQGVDVGERPRGVLLLGRDGTATAALVQRMRDVHPELGARLVDPDELAAIEPVVAGGHWACLVDTGHPVPPRLATERYFELAAHHGARLHTGVAALTWDGDACTGLAVGDRAIRADRVVVAAGAASCSLIDPSGAWAPVLASWGVNLELGLKARPRRLLIEAEIKSAQAGEVPAALDQAFSLICAEQRSWLGSTFLAEQPSPEDWEARVVARGATFVPAIAGAPVLARLACARPRSVDGRPLLGHVAGARNLLVATGNGGRGISTGAACAQLVAQALMSGSDEAIAPELRAARFPLESAR